MIILRRLLIVLVLIALIIIGFALISPDRVRVERSILIDAPRATVFALANDFRNSEKWSPWADIAPEVTEVTFSGARRGVGAAMRWVSEDAQVGSGMQTITASEPFDRIAVDLSFEGQGEATADYRFRDVDGQTEVTWAYAQVFGMSIPGRLIGRFLDGWIGPDYERGLSRLKTLAEQLPRDDFADLDVVELELEAMPLALIETGSEPAADAIAQALGQAFFEVLTFMRENELEQVGAPRKINLGVTDLYRFQAAIPVSGTTEVPGRVKVIDSYSGPALKINHIGSYASLSNTHEKALAYMAALGFEPSGPEWESYVSDPQTVAVDALKTEIYYPVRP